MMQDPFASLPSNRNKVVAEPDPNDPFADLPSKRRQQPPAPTGPRPTPRPFSREANDPRKFITPIPIVYENAQKLANWMEGVDRTVKESGDTQFVTPEQEKAIAKETFPFPSVSRFSYGVFNVLKGLGGNLKEFPEVYTDVLKLLHDEDIEVQKATTRGLGAGAIELAGETTPLDILTLKSLPRVVRGVTDTAKKAAIGKATLKRMVETERAARAAKVGETVLRSPSGEVKAAIKTAPIESPTVRVGDQVVAAEFLPAGQNVEDFRAARNKADVYINEGEGNAAASAYDPAQIAGEIESETVMQGFERMIRERAERNKKNSLPPTTEAELPPKSHPARGIELGPDYNPRVPGDIFDKATPIEGRPNVPGALRQEPKFQITLKDGTVIDFDDFKRRVSDAVNKGRMTMAEAERLMAHMVVPDEPPITSTATRSLTHGGEVVREGVPSVSLEERMGTRSTPVTVAERPVQLEPGAPRTTKSGAPQMPALPKDPVTANTALANAVNRAEPEVLAPRVEGAEQLGAAMEAANPQAAPGAMDKIMAESLPGINEPRLSLKDAANADLAEGYQDIINALKGTKMGLAAPLDPAVLAGVAKIVKGLTKRGIYEVGAAWREFESMVGPHAANLRSAFDEVWKTEKANMPALPKVQTAAPAKMTMGKMPNLPGQKSSGGGGHAAKKQAPAVTPARVAAASPEAQALSALQTEATRERVGAASAATKAASAKVSAAARKFGEVDRNPNSTPEQKAAALDEIRRTTSEYNSAKAAENSPAARQERTETRSPSEMAAEATRARLAESEAARTAPVSEKADIAGNIQSQGTVFEVLSKGEQYSVLQLTKQIPGQIRDAVHAGGKLNTSGWGVDMRNKVAQYTALLEKAKAVTEANVGKVPEPEVPAIATPERVDVGDRITDPGDQAVAARIEADNAKLRALQELQVGQYRGELINEWKIRKAHLEQVAEGQAAMPDRTLQGQLKEVTKLTGSGHRVMNPLPESMTAAAPGPVTNRMSQGIVVNDPVGDALAQNKARAAAAAQQPKQPVVDPGGGDNELLGQQPAATPSPVDAAVAKITDMVKASDPEAAAAMAREAAPAPAPSPVVPVDTPAIQWYKMPLSEVRTKATAAAAKLPPAIRAALDAGEDVTPHLSGMDKAARRAALQDMLEYTGLNDRIKTAEAIQARDAGIDTQANVTTARFAAENGLPAPKPQSIVEGSKAVAEKVAGPEPPVVLPTRAEAIRATDEILEQASPDADFTRAEMDKWDTEIELEKRFGKEDMVEEALEAEEQVQGDRLKRRMERTKERERLTAERTKRRMQGKKIEDEVSEGQSPEARRNTLALAINGRDIFRKYGYWDDRIVNHLRRIYGAERTVKILGMTGDDAANLVREIGGDTTKRTPLSAETAKLDVESQGAMARDVDRLDKTLTKQLDHFIKDPSGFMRTEAALAMGGAAVGGWVGATLGGESTEGKAISTITGVVLGFIAAEVGVGAMTGARRSAMTAKKASEMVAEIDTANLLAGPAMIKASLGSIGGISAAAAELSLAGRGRQARAGLKYFLNPAGGIKDYIEVLTSTGAKYDRFSGRTGHIGQGTGFHQPSGTMTDSILRQVTRPFIAADYVGTKTLTKMGFTLDEAKRYMANGSPTTATGQGALRLINNHWGLRMFAKFPKVRIGAIERGIEYTPGLHLYNTRKAHGAEQLSRRMRNAKAVYGGGVIAAGTAYGYYRDPGNIESGFASSLAGPAFLPAAAGISAGKALKSSGVGPAIGAGVGEFFSAMPQVGEAEWRMMNPFPATGPRIPVRAQPLRPARRLLEFITEGEQ